MMRKMGPLQGVLSMIPGLGKQLKDVDVDEAELDRAEAIILSMTLVRAAPAGPDRRLTAPADRPGQRHPVQQVNQLLNARKQMVKMMKQLGKGKMPALPGMPGRR